MWRKKKKHKTENNFVQLHLAITFVESKVLQELRYYIYNSTEKCNFNLQYLFFSSLLFSVEIIYVLLAVRLMIAGNLVLLHFSPRSPIALFFIFSFFIMFCFAIRLSFHEN